MPIKILGSNTQPFDPANVASKLPEPLQKPGGILLDLLSQMGGGDDPGGGIMNSAMPMTTIGPGAIPLEDEAGYLSKVAKTHLEDLMNTWPKAKDLKQALVNRMKEATSLENVLGSDAANDRTRLGYTLNVLERQKRKGMDPKFGIDIAASMGGPDRMNTLTNDLANTYINKK